MMTVLLLLTATHTRQAVFEVDEERGLTLVEVAEGVSTEDVTVATGCPFEVCPNMCSNTIYLIPLYLLVWGRCIAANVGIILYHFSILFADFKQFEANGTDLKTIYLC